MASRIREALEVLRERGWCKGRLENLVTGAVCVRGALSFAYMGEPAYMGVFQSSDEELLTEVARELYPDRCVTQHKYAHLTVNDHPDTTFADIELVLEKAAIRAEEKVE